MSLRLHNTLTNTVEPLQLPPQAGRPVSIYVCGVTPYDTTHLGHARTYLVFDVLIRYLERLGHGVRYVQNVTDVDDDILRKARELGVPYDDLGRANTERFIRDMGDLNVRPPDVYPRPSQETAGMQKIIQHLLERGQAYRSGNNVYFRVRADRDYGRLSRLSRDEMLALARERGGRPDDPLKEEPLDFLLWQGAAPGEPSWPSPWGDGRPGWHIECSAMALRYLGQSLDIHGGGDDLIFPHHESEIAQTEPYTGQRPFVRHWVHVGMVGLDGVKMSKSLGNMLFVSDLLRDYSVDALRLYLLSYPYRAAFSHDPGRLKRMARLSEELAEAARQAEALDTASGAPRADPVLRVFYEALDEDLGTPAAIEALAQRAAGVRQSGGNGREARSGRSSLLEMAEVLGLTLGRTAPARAWPLEPVAATPGPSAG